jgi:ABC-type transporter Mla MlaB component
VVKFVRNPTTNWADLDQKELDRESNYSKQALKEMIERKRRNDFVRKREFDMLRKLRKREVLSGSDAGGRPSFFQSSLPSKPDDRAMTLKKIDEIEAQMSMQWWKTKQGGMTGAAPLSTGSSFPNSGKSPIAPQDEARPEPIEDTERSAAYDKTAPASLEQREAVRKHLPVAPPAPAASHAHPDTPNAADYAAAYAPAPPGKPARPLVMGGLAANYEDGPSGFSASKLYAMEVDDVQHDPELEEAAIRFANGDTEGAEAGLLEALGPHGSRSGHEETWYALFDLYRAAGWHDPFESAAIDFANHFNRSAPIWYSIPELVSRMSGSSASAAAPARSSGVDWRCPPQLSVQTLAALNAALGKAPMPWHMDWSKLQAIDPSAIVPLTRLFSGWATQPLQLHFSGCDQLDALLKSLTPSGKSSYSQDAWLLRMETLRIMHRPDEFELAALDFCVTYEVSPPAWEGARCEFKSLDDEGNSRPGGTIVGEAFRDSYHSNFGPSTAETPFDMAQNAQQVTVELAGQIQGDPTAALEEIEGRMQGADVLVISCAKLVRVDFSAAGTLLNWVSTLQANGRFVQFSEVHRLVAAFFNVIGISDTARVTLRSD